MLKLTNDIFNLLSASLILIAAFAFGVWGFWQGADWLNEMSVGHRFIYSNRFFNDLFVVLALVILCFSKHRVTNILFFSMLTILCLIYFIQATSFSETGRFLPSIAIENARHANFLATTTIFIKALVWFSGFIIACVLFYRLTPKKPNIKSRIICSLVFILLVVISKNDTFIIGEKTKQERRGFFDNPSILIKHESPIGSFFTTIKEYVEYLKLGTTLSPEIAKNVTLSIENYHLGHYGSALGSVEPDYPLVRRLRKSNVISKIQSDQNIQGKKNVIVFFVEGLSSRIIQPYSNLFPNISPNIEAFSQESTTIKDYYNHTFATYRGLSGQLCSIYPVDRLLAKTRYRCLPHILNDNNYHTRFMISQRRKKTGLYRMLRQTGVDHVDDYQELGEIKAIEGYYPDNRLYASDKSLIKGLITRLEKDTPNNKPFFIGLYNIETHTGFKIGNDGTKYHNPIGKNHYILDTFHNFDVAFGQFWQYFKKSKYYESTIVILTSDHATFPSDDYVRLVADGKEVNGELKFSDSIPLVIYHPDSKKNLTVSAKYSTSIDFAPSLLNLLGLTPDTAPFIGKSIFDPENNEIGIIVSGPIYNFANYYRIKSNDWLTISSYSLNKLPDKYKKYRRAINKIEHIKFQQALERANLLWPKQVNNSIDK